MTIKTKPTRPGEEKLFLKKAKQFYEGMNQLKEVNPDSAAVLAINCVISSCDALTAAKLGVKCADLHESVVDLVGRISEVDTGKKSQIRDVLSMKTKAEYDSRLITQQEAETAIKQAGRFFEWVQTRI